MTELVSIRDCPPGLFRFGKILGFKTEYCGMETVGPIEIPGDQVRWIVGNHSDAYVVESGESFWGGAPSREARDALMVEPVALGSRPCKSGEGAGERLADRLRNRMQENPMMATRDRELMVEAAAALTPDATQTREAEVVRLRQALEDVCSPLAYLQRMAEAEGNRLGGMAYAMANDINTVKGIARAALADVGTGFTVPQWDDATDALAAAMEAEDVCASDLVRIVVEALGLPPLSPEARLQHMIETRA